MDHDKTYLFDLLYDDQGIGETPGERAQDRVERLHQAIDRWGRTYQPTDYSGLEIQIAREMEKDTTMSTQAIDLETHRLYDGGAIPPWAIRFLEPVGLRPWARYIVHGRIRVSGNEQEASFVRGGAIVRSHRGNNLQEAMTGLMAKLALEDPHSLFASSSLDVNTYAVAIMSVNTPTHEAIREGEYKVLYDTDLVNYPKATLFWLPRPMPFPRRCFENPTLRLEQMASSDLWNTQPTTPWAHGRAGWQDPMRGVVSLLERVDSAEYLRHMSALQAARESEATRNRMMTQEKMHGIRQDPPYTAIMKDRIDAKGKHPVYRMVVPEKLKMITMTFRVEKNYRLPPPPPFRPEEFRTTQHLGSLGLANMRHPAFERPTRPERDRRPDAFKPSVVWESDQTPQANDRRARMLKALGDVLQTKRLLTPSDLQERMGELKLLVTLENSEDATTLWVTDAIDRNRFKGYHLALTVRVEGDRNPARTDRFMDTLRSVVKTG